MNMRMPLKTTPLSLDAIENNLEYSGHCIPETGLLKYFLNGLRDSYL